MENPSAEVLLGVIDYAEAKRIQARLEERGVRLRLKNNPETCSSGGCKPTVEIFALETDLAKVQEFFAEEKQRSLDGLDFDPQRESLVFDPEQEKATCPACGTVFSTTSKECPDCGLCFG